MKYMPAGRVALPTENGVADANVICDSCAEARPALSNSRQPAIRTFVIDWILFPVSNFVAAPIVSAALRRAPRADPGCVNRAHKPLLIQRVVTIYPFLHRKFRTVEGQYSYHEEEPS